MKPSSDIDLFTTTLPFPVLVSLILFLRRTFPGCRPALRMMTLRAPGSHRLLDHIPFPHCLVLAGIQALWPSSWVSICSTATLTKCPERSGLEEERALALAGDGRHQQFAFVASQLECARDGSLADAEPAQLIIGHAVMMPGKPMLCAA
jgi:hypothetical protein